MIAVLSFKVSCATPPNNATETVTPDTSVATTNNDDPVVPEEDYLKHTLDQQTHLINQHWNELNTVLSLASWGLAFIGIIISVLIYVLNRNTSQRIRKWEDRAEKKIEEIEKLCERADKLVSKELESQIQQFVNDAKRRIDESEKKASERIEALSQTLQMAENAAKEFQAKNQLVESGDGEKMGETKGELSPTLKKQIEEIVKSISSVPEDKLSPQEYYLKAIDETDMDKRIQLLTHAIIKKNDYLDAKN